MVPAPSNVADYPATFNEFITRFGSRLASTATAAGWSRMSASSTTRSKMADE